MTFHRIFAPYDAHMDGLYEVAEGEMTFIRQEVWDWFEDQMGQQTLGGLCGRWMTQPDTQKIKGEHAHGREFIFRHEKDAMLFKLTWL